MFSNKKNNFPPRPRFPDPEHMLEDLSKATVDDVAFRALNKDEISAEGDTDDMYKKVKAHLNIKQQLKQLENTLKKEEEQLRESNREITGLADDIRRQAQAALIM